MIFDVPSTVNSPMWFGSFYEISNLILFFIFFLHCLYYRGKWDTLKIFVIGAIYGVLLENSGGSIIPGISQGYFYEQNYNFYLFEFFGIGFRISQVPLTTHLAWCFFFYISLAFWEKITQVFPKIRNNILLGVLIFASSGLLLDLQLDIVATRFYWWVWNDSLNPIWFGVPLTNYIAWFAAIGVFGGFWVWLHTRHDDWEPKKQAKYLCFLLPVIMGVDALVFFGIQGIFTTAGWILVPG